MDLLLDLGLELVSFVSFYLKLFLVICELANLPLKLNDFSEVFCLAVRSLILKISRSFGASCRVIVRDRFVGNNLTVTLA